MEIKINVILESVRKAGDIFLEEYKTRAIPTTKSELMRELSSIDERCIALIQPDLEAYHPEIPFFIGDEFNKEVQRQPLKLPQYWICDAMDGAIQYIQHMPGWTINLVLVQQGKPIFSVIYDPLSKEIFWAIADIGAYMNGNLIKPLLKADSDTMVAVFNYGHEKVFSKETSKLHGEVLSSLLNKFGIVRNYGPHGLQLAYIGKGRIDIFCQLGLDTYNWLAGMLIAREAGADILNSKGLPWNWGDESLVVSAPNLANQYLLSMESNEQTVKP